MIIENILKEMCEIYNKNRKLSINEFGKEYIPFLDKLHNNGIMDDDQYASATSTYSCMICEEYEKTFKNQIIQFDLDYIFDERMGFKRVKKKDKDFNKFLIHNKADPKRDQNRFGSQKFVTYYVSRFAERAYLECVQDGNFDDLQCQVLYFKKQSLNMFYIIEPYALRDLNPFPTLKMICSYLIMLPLVFTLLSPTLDLCANRMITNLLAEMYDGVVYSHSIKNDQKVYSDDFNVAIYLKEKDFLKELDSLFECKFSIEESCIGVVKDSDSFNEIMEKKGVYY